MEKQLMKIDDCYLGKGGYEDAMIGIWFRFSSPGSGVSDSRHGFWTTDWTEGCKWTEQSRREYLGDLVLKINKWLENAKVDRIDKLKGVPVEVTFDNQRLIEWRILTEVL